MTNLSKIETVFSIFHDGVISFIESNRRQINLKIECQYLAEIINESYIFFIVQLKDVSRAELELWSTPTNVLNTISEISKFELEINSSEIFENYVNVSCHIDDEIPGGNLKLSCDDIEVFDQENKKIEISQLTKIAEKYWNNFR